MGKPLTYAKAEGPPADWILLRVIDLETGEEVKLVTEVNTEEGWLIRLATDQGGKTFVDPETDKAATERVTGRFELRREGEDTQAMENGL